MTDFLITRALITGATGNVGIEVIKALAQLDHHLDIYAGIRGQEDNLQKLDGFSIKHKLFDFTDVTSYELALDSVNILFLLRPPQISEVEKYFKPLIEVAVRSGVSHIVFLSVQGVEKSTIIPHHKIEKLITESKIHYTFLRPAYFMQNFTSTLRYELTVNKRIFLPAGQAKFTLVDVSDIGAVAAKILIEPENHQNQSYELTCHQKLTFSEMASKLSEGLHTSIRYESPNLLQFFLVKRKEQIPTMLILVMIMLHYLPRFQKEPLITDWVERIIKKQPKTFEQFIIENKNALCS